MEEGNKHQQNFVISVLDLIMEKNVAICRT